MQDTKPEWRDFFRRIIADPFMKQRLARSAGLNPVTLERWATGESNPKVESLRRVFTVLTPNERENFLRLLEREEEGAALAKGLRSPGQSMVADVAVRIRINEEPLTVHNLTTILSALTELSTKYWLLAKEQFADLIEYTQTHNDRFVEETNIVVTRVSYNSPFHMEWKVDLSAPSVADALVKTIDGVKQRQTRLEKAELENQKIAQGIQHAEQSSAHEQQMAVLEQEQKRLEIEQRRLEILEKQLEFQKKSIEAAMEIATTMVDLLHPHADSATRAMAIQAFLPNLVQLQSGKGLELALPISPEDQKKSKQNE